MKCLTPGQITVWWESHFRFSKLPINVSDWPRESTDRFGIDLDVFPAARLRFASSSIVRWLAEPESDDLLVWVFECGIWPSSEDWNLYQMFRETCGGRSRLEDGPGHLFMLHEREDAATLVFLSIAFGWGIIAASFDGRRAMSFNHDGHFSIWCEDAASRDWLASDLRK
ncbi:MAG: hypothetical protein IT438_16115 [Phycisphaerales bacterium]|nr:hypothetical protein [Phycisphaerales bacterium]